MNNLKKQSIILVITLMITAQYINVSAAPSDSGETLVDIEFRAGNGPTYPVNPEKPEIPGNGGEESGVMGDLAIVSVSDFSFTPENEVLEITGVENTYSIVTYMPNIQIVDLRGTMTGWTLQAHLSEFTNEHGVSMPGSSIIIANSRPNSANMNINPPTAIKNVRLYSGDNVPSDVIRANNNSGMGQWVMRFYPPIESSEQPYIWLDVPIESVGINTATINWILKNTP